MKLNLSLNLAGIKMKNPIMNAPGIFGFGPGFAQIRHPENLGAIVTKTVTLKPRKGNPLPQIIKIESGIMNSVGLTNEGLEVFITGTLPKFLKLGPPIIASIAGDTINDYCRLAKELDKTKGVSGIEINTSCPNVHGGNIPFGSNPNTIKDLVSRVRRETNLPLIIKLTPNVGKIEPLVQAAEKAGADALSLINTLLGLAIDIKRKKPILGGVTGGISGKAIKHHALLRVWQAAKVTKLPIIGIGGITTAEDAIAFIMAGAIALGVGVANYENPNVTTEIITGLEDYIKINNLKSLNEIKGII